MSERITWTPASALSLSPPWLPWAEWLYSRLSLVSMVAFITVVHNKGDRWPMSETSETVNQSESFPFLIPLSDIFPSNVWIKTATNRNGRLMAQDKEGIIDEDFSPWAQIAELLLSKCLPCVSICVFVKENTKALLSLHANKRIWWKEKQMSVEKCLHFKSWASFSSLITSLKKNSCQFSFVSMYVFHLHHLDSWMTTRVPRCS